MHGHTIKYINSIRYNNRRWKNVINLLRPASGRANERRAKKPESMNILVQRRPHWWLLAILRSGPIECTACIWHHLFSFFRSFYYSDYCSAERANHLNGNRFRPVFLFICSPIHNLATWQKVFCACAACHLIHSNCTKHRGSFIDEITTRTRRNGNGNGAPAPGIFT